MHSVEFEAEAGTSMLATVKSKSSARFVEPQPAKSKVGRTFAMLRGRADNIGPTATAMATDASKLMTSSSMNVEDGKG